MSKREAAKRADISESRWRQLELGYESVRGNEYPVKTTPETVVNIARALALDPGEMLELAGFDPEMADLPRGSIPKAIDVSGLLESDIEKVHDFVAFLKSQRAASDKSRRAPNET